VIVKEGNTRSFEAKYENGKLFRKKAYEEQKKFKNHKKFPGQGKTPSAGSPEAKHQEGRIEARQKLTSR